MYILVIPSHLYDHENWTLKQRHVGSLKTAEMKFMRRTVRHSFLDHRRNEEILEELKLDPFEKKLTQ
jgi:hypothetical protein